MFITVFAITVTFIGIILGYITDDLKTMIINGFLFIANIIICFR